MKLTEVTLVASFTNESKAILTLRTHAKKPVHVRAEPKVAADGKL